MLDIYAQTFMTATRHDTHRVRSLRAAKQPGKRWLPRGHWWVQPIRDIDLDNL